jgi:hypothetical protein
MDELVRRLYHASPPGAYLYHYTSLAAMRGILSESAIWATDIRYVTDASELRYLMERLRSTMMGRTGSGADDVLRQFDNWIADRLPRGYMVFAASFSERGNLLSQWRAYCPPAKGVSLGFQSGAVFAAAERQGFRVGRCIYEYGDQQKILDQILDEVLAIAVENGPDVRRHPSQSHYSVFETIEAALLQIGALFKNPAFIEEAEWRAVSPVMTRYVGTGIQYREGPSMLIPYIALPLAENGTCVPLGEVFVGPTPHMDLAMNSVQQCLSDHKVSPTIINSRIPYRTW